MFSRRLSWSDPPNALSALVAQKRSAGVKVLDLTESNPTRAGFAYDAEILRGLADPAALRYEPIPQGLESARTAVAAHYAARGTVVDPQDILLTASTSEAYAYLFKLLCDPGDRILTPRPSYPLFEYLAALESVEVGQYPLRYDGVWHVDFDALEGMLTPRVKAVVMVNPNNPTGSFLKQAELRRLEELALHRGFALISDEVFSDYGFSRDAKRVETLIGPRRTLTFSMSGLSKVAGLPQLKLGWIVVQGEARREALSRLELIADTYLSISTPVQVGLSGLLVGSTSVQSQIRERTRANFTVLRERFRGSAATLLHVEGGWYGILQVPYTRSEEAWTLALLRERDVLVQPGFFFDFESEAYLIVSLLTDSATFAEGVSRLRSAI